MKAFCILADGPGWLLIVVSGLSFLACDDPDPPLVEISSNDTTFVVGDFVLSEGTAMFEGSAALWGLGPDSVVWIEIAFVPDDSFIVDVWARSEIAHVLDSLGESTGDIIVPRLATSLRVPDSSMLGVGMEIWNDTEFRMHTFEAMHGGGNGSLYLAFTNDYWHPLGEDANIFIARVRYRPKDPVTVILDENPVTVVWDGNKEPDLRGYVVGMGESTRVYTFLDSVKPDPPLGIMILWDIMGLASVPDTAYTIEIPIDTTVYFAVGAYDSAGNLSGWSREVSAMVSLPDDSSAIVCDITDDGKTDDIDWFMMYWFHLWTLDSLIAKYPNNGRLHDNFRRADIDKDAEVTGVDIANYNFKCR